MLEGIVAKLLAPQAIAAAVSSDQREAADRQRQTLNARAATERERAEIACKLDRAQTLCIDGGMEIEELKRRSLPLKACRAELETVLSERDEPAVLSLHHGVAEAYRRMAEQLREALDDVDGENARDGVRALIERMEFIPRGGWASSIWRSTATLRGGFGSPAGPTPGPGRTKAPWPVAAGLLKGLTGVR
ncbi:hypothetical protein [Brevundimonas bacteroides]|uniref:hypothetical protein n=1 Tax=Brevundimonas bacteroides TaxID=74311 RepID=UPI0004976656|nr:hypothetical protein [Brevundimonas bacteroides]